MHDILEYIVCFWNRQEVIILLLLTVCVRVCVCVCEGVISIHRITYKQTISSKRYHIQNLFSIDVFLLFILNIQFIWNPCFKMVLKSVWNTAICLIHVKYCLIVIFIHYIIIFFFELLVIFHISQEALN